MGMMRGFLGLGLALAGQAAANEARPIPAAEHRSLAAFADANKGCGEWSDGCAVCSRQDDGTFACSLPGIACQPVALSCRIARKDKAPR